MSKVLVTYYSRSGNTKAMAEIISTKLAETGNSVDLKGVTTVDVDSLPDYDGIIVGTPVYYGSMAAEIKKLIDDSVKYHRQLDGKIGGAFASSANIGGGNETAVQDIINAMLIHGMIVQGDPKGDHYGPVAIRKPDERATENCERFAERFSKLLKRVKFTQTQTRRIHLLQKKLITINLSWTDDLKLLNSH